MHFSGHEPWDVALFWISFSQKRRGTCLQMTRETCGQIHCQEKSPGQLVEVRLETLPEQFLEKHVSRTAFGVHRTSVHFQRSAT